MSSAFQSSVPFASKVTFDDHTFTVHLTDGRVLSVPYAWSARLAAATPAQRANYELNGRGAGIHWPDVDEDLSVAGLLRGTPVR